MVVTCLHMVQNLDNDRKRIMAGYCHTLSFRHGSRILSLDRAAVSEEESTCCLFKYNRGNSGFENGNLLPRLRSASGIIGLRRCYLISGVQKHHMQMIIALGLLSTP